jgi:hypothetical protein
MIIYQICKFFQKFYQILHTLNYQNLQLKKH